MPSHTWNKLRTAFCVLVCTGVSLTHIGCQAAPSQEAGPTSIVLEDVGIGLVDLPDGCTQVESTGYPLELSCELLETTETPAGPEGAIWLELGDPSERYIELEDVSALDTIREEQQPLFEALPGGEFFGPGGQLFYGPFGAARYTRGRYQGEDGTTLQRIRLFMVHPRANQLVTFVYDHPLGDNEDTKARLNNHLLVLLEHLRPADEMQPVDGSGAATDEPAAD